MKCFERSPYPPPPPPCNQTAYLLQRILAGGETHRRCQSCPVDLCELPDCAPPPYTVTDAFVCASPQWREDGCPDWRGLKLLVTLPLALRLRDGNGCVYTVASRVEAPLTLRMDVPPGDCWRGQVSVQGAVRLSCRSRRLSDRCGEVPLEVYISGYLLRACPTSRGRYDACRDDRPLYPPPVCPR